MKGKNSNINTHFKGAYLVLIFTFLTFQSISQVQVISGSHATSKSSYSAGNGNNRMLVVAVADECNNCVGSVSSITYGSTELTFQVERTRGGDVVAEIWTLDEAGIAAEGGSASFTVNWSSGPTDELFSVVTIANVDQSTPVPDTDRARGSTDNLTIGPLDAGDNEMVYYASATRAVTSHTPSTNYTELSDQSSGLTLANAYRTLTSASSESPTATMVVSSSMVMVGLYFQVNSEITPATTDGDWNVGTTWGGSCSSGCTEGIDYPGPGWNVYIPGTVDITIPAGQSVSCNDLYLNSDRNTTVATLTLADNTASLSVGNDLSILASGATGASGTSLLDMNGGDVDVAANLILEESEASGFAGGSSSNSKTGYAPADGTDRLMVVTVGDENNNSVGTITSITWGSTALTFQVAEERGNDIRVEIWTLDEAGITSETGAQDFTVNWDAGPNSEKFNVVTLFNVNQTTPVAATKANANGGGTSTIQASPGLSVSTNDLYFYATGSRANNQTHTSSTGYTELSDQTGGGWSMANAFNQLSSGGTEQPTATWSSSSNLVIAGMVVNNSSPSGSTQEAQILTDGGTLTVGGDITMYSDGNNVEIDLATTSGSTLIFGGDLIEDGSSSTDQTWSVNNNSTISYNGSAAQTIQTTVGNTTITTLDVLTLDGSGAKTLEGNLTVNSNLNMNGNATFANGGNTLTYGGTAVLTYAGSATQTTGDELTATIEGLAINNTNNVNLNSDVIVNDDISFSAGMLILGTNDVIANTISGYDENEYFVTDGTGYLQRNVGASSTVDFPVGISTTSLTNLVQLTPGDLSTFQVRVSNTFSNAPNDANQVVDAEWNIDRTAGSAATTVRLTWRDDGSMTFGSSFSASDTQTEIGRWNGSAWVETSTTAKDATGPEYYFEATGFSSFSPFAAGSGGMSLPVELVYFDAIYDEDAVVVSWETASEINNDYFTIERSVNGLEYEVIGTVDGHGTTSSANAYLYTDLNPVPGYSYYRLRQMDYDGQFEIFDPVTVHVNSGEITAIYPNPSESRHVNLFVADLIDHETVEIRLYDLAGHLVFTDKNITGIAGHTLPVNFSSDLPSGLYNLHITTSRKTESLKFILK